MSPPIFDNPDPPHSAPRTRNQHLWHYFSQYVGWFMAGALFLVATNALNLAIPAYIGRAVQTLRDALAQSGTPADALSAAGGQLVNIALIIIVLAVVGGVTRVFSRTMIFNASRYIEFDLRNEIYAKLSALGRPFFDSMSTGDITSRSANDISFVRVFYAISFLHIINTAVAYAIAMNQMLRINWKLTLVCLIPYPIILFVLRYLVRAVFE